MPRLPETFRNAVPLQRKLIYELLEHRDYPCFTIMMPTHRMPPERETDPLQFKNLVSELANKIRANGLDQHLDMIEELHQMENDRDFWNHQERGLAIFIAPAYTQVVKVPVTLPSLTIVSDTFHVKPLYRYYQDSGRFQLLVLGLNHVQLWEGDRYELEERQLDGKVPTTMAEALGDDLTDNHLHAGSVAKGRFSQAGQTARGTGQGVHGYMEKSQEKDNDASRFFRIVDEQIQEHFSKPSGLPLILAALPEHHHVFRSQSKNDLLIEDGIQADVSALDSTELKKRAWEVFSIEYNKQLQAILDQQRLAESQNMSHTLLEDVMLDAIDGKVDILLVEENRMIKGRVMEEARQIEYLPAGVDDVLDDLSAIVIEKSGRVVLLPANRMPHNSGAVSINRY